MTQHLNEHEQLEESAIYKQIDLNYVLQFYSKQCNNDHHLS